MYKFLFKKNAHFYLKKMPIFISFLLVSCNIFCFCNTNIAWLPLVHVHAIILDNL